MPALSFEKQFVPPVESGAKRHSIRGYRKYPFKVGDPLALYFGLRTKHCRLLFRTVITKVDDIRILAPIPDSDMAQIVVDGVSLWPDAMERLAREDGFANHAAMLQWWLRHHDLPFRGQIIHWQFPGGAQ